MLAKPRKLQEVGELPYFLRVLRNTHIDIYRKKQRRIHSDQHVEEAELADERSRLQPEKVVETREVFVAIANLSDIHRDYNTHKTQQLLLRVLVSIDQDTLHT